MEMDAEQVIAEEVCVNSDDSLNDLTTTGGTSIYGENSSIGSIFNANNEVDDDNDNNDDGATNDGEGVTQHSQIYLSPFTRPSIRPGLTGIGRNRYDAREMSSHFDT